MKTRQKVSRDNATIQNLVNNLYGKGFDPGTEKYYQVIDYAQGMLYNRGSSIDSTKYYLMNIFDLTEQDANDLIQAAVALKKSSMIDNEQALYNRAVLLISLGITDFKQLLGRLSWESNLNGLIIREVTQKALDAELVKSHKKTSGKWLGGTTCDLCGRDLNTFGSFVDGKTKMGPWALMCSECFKEIGIGTGVGKGQKYDSSTLEKISG